MAGVVRGVDDLDRARVGDRPDILVRQPDDQVVVPVVIEVVPVVDADLPWGRIGRRDGKRQRSRASASFARAARSIRLDWR